jgi:tetratricopeptide (TPR) repeat protein
VSQLRIVATSRARLRLSAEREYPLDPLTETEAVTFFVARAQAGGRQIEPDETVALLCRRLDNLPLALELAAARIKLFDAKSLVNRLDRALPLLTGGSRDAPVRQRTLRATIEWSYDLLDSNTRSLFARLSAFRGTFSVEAADVVCGADVDGLQALLEFSLLKQSGSDRLLILETIREFAAERLEQAGEADELRRRHAEHYASVAEGIRSGVADMSTGRDQIETFEIEQDNFRAALEHFLTTGPSERALELVDSLWIHWMRAGQLDEGERWTTRALAAADQTPRPLLESTIGTLGDFARFRGDLERAASLKQTALAMARTIGDKAGVAANLHDLAGTFAQLGEFPRARELATEGLAIRKELGKPLGVAHALDALWDIAFFEHDYEEASRLDHETIAILERHGPDTAEMAMTRWGLSECLRRCGRSANARDELREALVLARRLSLRQHVSGMLYTAAALITARDPAQAAKLIGASDTLLAESGFGLFDPTECKKVVEAVRDRLDNEAYEAARAEGAAQDVDEALRLAFASTVFESKAVGSG